MMPADVATGPVNETEVRVRLVNAALVVLSVAIAVVALWHTADAMKIDSAALSAASSSNAEILRAQMQNISTFSTASFGALTTFLGTALGAYFGIAAAASGQKGVTAALSSAQQQLSTLAAQQQGAPGSGGAPGGTTSSTQATAPPGPPQDPGHAGNQTPPPSGGLGSDVAAPVGGS